jgi:hypothetical protein
MRVQILALVIAAVGLTACETADTAAPPAKRHFTRMAPIADDGDRAQSASMKKVALATPARVSGKKRDTTVTAPVSSPTPPAPEAAPSTPAPEPAAPPAPDPSASASVAEPTTPESAPSAPVEPAKPDDSATSTADASTPSDTTAPATQPDIVADSSTVAATPTSDPTPTSSTPSWFDPETLMKAEIGGFPLWLAGIVGLALIGALAVGMSGGRKPRDPYGRNQREPEPDRDADVDDMDAEPEPA